MLRLIESRVATPLRAWCSDLPRDLETIVATAMDPDPAARYASADTLADDLERLLALRPIRARRAGVLARTWKLVRRNRAATLGLVAGSIVSLAVAALLGSYVFFVPGWIDEHVREARVKLLDPVRSNAMFEREWYAWPASARMRKINSTALDSSVAHYDAALRWAWFDDELQAERDTVADARSSSAVAVHSGLRCAGLAAYLNGDVDAALAAWTQWTVDRSALATPDPFVDAALGMLHRVREEPARAYPRLRDAVRGFPNVGFLAVYLADAALQCGDVAEAEKLLDAAADMPSPDEEARERAWADLLALTGRDAQAEQFYARAASATPAGIHYARFLSARGRMEEALDVYVEAGEVLRGPRIQREIRLALEEWWAALSLRQRRERIADALIRDATGPRSLDARLRTHRRAAAIADRGHGAGTNGRSPDSSTNGAPTTSSLIESLGLPELAETLEVDDMKLWTHWDSGLVGTRAFQSADGRTLFARVWSRSLALALLFARSDRRWIKAALALGVSAGAVGGAQAQCRTYDPTLGTLPEAQGWARLDSGNHPTPPTVIGGELHQGPTLSHCTSGWQYWFDNTTSIDFDEYVRMEATLRVVSSNDINVATLGCTYSGWRAGYYMNVQDAQEHFFFVGIALGAVYLANAQAQDPAQFPRVLVDTSGYHTYRLEVWQGVATLFYDGAPIASLPVGVETNPGTVNYCLFGDGAATGTSETYLRSVELVTAPHVSTYCTAGTTTNGCNASMSASGTPSVAASSGFTLTCSNVEGQKFGLIFYGVNGPKPTVWGPGSTSYLCVKAPVQRTPPESSGGTAGACDGSFSIDFLSYLSTHPGALGQPFAAGQCVHAQTWFRDPPAPGTTNLSNGLQFTTMP
jgi:tetratricopeptide (TPR) repeat protein